MTALEILQAARAKVELGWCQGSAATDRHGEPVSEDSPNAVCWCAAGACLAVSGFDEANAMVWLLRQAAGISTGIGDWNDTPGRTRLEVLALFDRAIEEQGQ